MIINTFWISKSDIRVTLKKFLKTPPLKKIPISSIKNFLETFEKNFQWNIFDFLEHRVSNSSWKFLSQALIFYWKPFSNASKNISRHPTAAVKISRRSVWPSSIRQLKNDGHTTLRSEDMPGKVKNYILKNRVSNLNWKFFIQPLLFGFFDWKFFSNASKKFSKRPTTTIKVSRRSAWLSSLHQCKNHGHPTHQTW